MIPSTGIPGGIILPGTVAIITPSELAGIPITAGISASVWATVGVDMDGRPIICTIRGIMLRLITTLRLPITGTTM